MNKNYMKILGAAILLMAGGPQLNAQTGCALSNTTNLHSTGCQFGDQIDYFELDGIGNSSGCASNGYYDYFSTPTWTLQIGQTYTWSADVGNFNWQQGFAVWIDLDNDGFFTSAEQLGNGGFPAFNHSGSFMVPFSASPGAGHRMRLRCDFANSVGNTNQTACEQYGPPNFTFDYGETEDYDVYLLPPPPCTGTPVANSIVGPTAAICPNTSSVLGLSTTYTVGGITYVWQSATTSSVGPWTTMTGTNMSTQTGSLTQATWYQVIIGCSNSSSSITTTAFSVEVQGTVVDSIPYFEGFEGISSNDQLPNCSWAADNLGSEAFTFTNTGFSSSPKSGNNYAAFYYWPGGTNSFYTNGIYLHSGVTYSASVWYITNMWGDNNWEDFSLLLGPSQSPASQMTIASTPGDAIATTYKALTHTFTVPTSMVYYAGVRATSNTNAFAEYLSWDDLSITAPCMLNPVTVNLTSTGDTVCEKSVITFNASGADEFTWSTGATGSSLSFSATTSGWYTVTGTDSRTGCQASASRYLVVNEEPFVAIVADKPEVCSGGQVNLTAVGDAVFYNWSNSGAGTNVMVQPSTGNSTYSVTGTTSDGCSRTASINITVNPLPGVSASTSHSPLCVGDQVLLTGHGANTFQWQSGSNFIQSNPAVINIHESVSYTVIGTDAKGCQGTSIIDLEAITCTGLTETAGKSVVSVYPNPGNGAFVVNTGKSGSSIEVTDIVGRKVFTTVTTTGSKEINISALSAGLYYFTIRNGAETAVIRVIKN